MAFRVGPLCFFPFKLAVFKLKVAPVPVSLRDWEFKEEYQEGCGPQTGSASMGAQLLDVGSLHPLIPPCCLLFVFGFLVLLLLGLFRFFVCLFFLDYSPGVTPTTPHTLTHPFPLDTPPPPSAPVLL